MPSPNPENLARLATVLRKPEAEVEGIEAILRLRRTGEDDAALDRLRWGLVALHEPLMKSLVSTG